MRYIKRTFTLLITLTCLTSILLAAPKRKYTRKSTTAVAALTLEEAMHNLEKAIAAITEYQGTHPDSRENESPRLCKRKQDMLVKVAHLNRAHRCALSQLQLLQQNPSTSDKLDSLKSLIEKSAALLQRQAPTNHGAAQQQDTSTAHHPENPYARTPSSRDLHAIFAATMLSDEKSHSEDEENSSENEECIYARTPAHVTLPSTQTEN